MCCVSLIPVLMHCSHLMDNNKDLLTYLLTDILLLFCSRLRSGGTTHIHCIGVDTLAQQPADGIQRQ